jgi:hypothetical protein
MAGLLRAFSGGFEQVGGRGFPRSVGFEGEFQFTPAADARHAKRRDTTSRGKEIHTPVVGERVMMIALGAAGAVYCGTNRTIRHGRLGSRAVALARLPEVFALNASRQNRIRAGGAARQNRWNIADNPAAKALLRLLPYRPSFRPRSSGLADKPG